MEDLVLDVRFSYLLFLDVVVSFLCSGGGAVNYKNEQVFIGQN